jgi:hypothetical protein
LYVRVCRVPCVKPSGHMASARIAATRAASEGWLRARIANSPPTARQRVHGERLSNGRFGSSCVG